MIDFNCRLSNMELLDCLERPTSSTSRIYNITVQKYVSGREVQLGYVNRVKLPDDEAILSFKISFSGKLRI